MQTVRLISPPVRLPGDARPLGAAVCALLLDGEAIGLNDVRLGIGFHPAESGWRWTDGAAQLLLGASDAGRTLEVDVAGVAAQHSAAA